MINEPIKDKEFLVGMMEKLSDEEFAVLEQDLKKDKQKTIEGMLNVMSVMTEMVRLKEVNKIQQDLIDNLQAQNKVLQEMNVGDPDKKELDIVFDCVMMKLNGQKDENQNWYTRQLLVFFFKKSGLTKYVISLLDQSDKCTKAGTWFKVLETNVYKSEDELKERYQFWAEALNFKNK